VDRHVYLIGMPGAGKTSVGSALSVLLDAPFVDLDAEIERDAGLTIPEIFRSLGEERFRELEAESLGRLAGAPASVVATGGGAPLRLENQRRMHDTGTVIFLRPSLGTLRKRIGQLLGVRPLVRGPVDLDRLYRERDAAYRHVADLEFDADADVSALARTIAEVVG
jgi:shikimate kinase